MERVEFFNVEIQLKAQKERDALAIVRVPGRLYKEVAKIVEHEEKKRERSAIDFV